MAQQAQEQFQQKHQGLASRTPREEANLRPIQGHGLAAGAKRSNNGAENVDFKNAQAFQPHSGHGQGLGMMVGQTAQTSSQPHLQQYNLINTIQQQITHNNFVIQP